MGQREVNEMILHDEHLENLAARGTASELKAESYEHEASGPMSGVAVADELMDPNGAKQLATWVGEVENEGVLLSGIGPVEAGEGLDRVHPAELLVDVHRVEQRLVETRLELVGGNQERPGCPGSRPRLLAPG